LCAAPPGSGNAGTFTGFINLRRVADAGKFPGRASGGPEPSAVIIGGFNSTPISKEVVFVGFFISDAWAQGGGQGSPFPSLIMLVVLFGLFYVLLIRPQQKRQKEHKQMAGKLAKGDEVVTQGGVLGRITKVGDAFLNLEVSEGTEIKIQRTAVATLMPKGTIKSL
jgi:preprotein translocase subunit YajC